MKCIGRTSILMSRCKRDVNRWFWPVCIQHRFQILIFLFITIPTFLGVYFGLYRDAIEPIFKEDTNELEQKQLDEIKINQELLKEIKSKLNQDEQLIEYWKHKYIETYKELERIKYIKSEEKRRGLEDMYRGNFELVQNLYITYLNKSLNSKETQSIIYFEIGNLHALNLNLNEARNSWAQSLKINPSNYEALKSLILIDYYLGNLDDAQENIEKLIKMGKSDVTIFNSAFKFYPCGRDKIKLINLYIDILREKSLFSQVEIIVRDLIIEYEKNGIKDSCEYGSLISTLGLIQFESGYYDRAEYNYLKSLSLDTNVIILNNLGDLYLEMNKFDLAGMFFMQSYNLRKSTLGSTNLQTGFAANRLGVYYEKMGELDKSLEFLEETLRIYKTNIPQIHYYYPVLYNSFGVTFISLGKLDDAEKVLFLALKLNESIYGKNNLKLARNYYNLAYLRYTQAKLENISKTAKKQFIEDARSYIYSCLILSPNDPFSLQLKDKIELFIKSQK